MPENRSLISVSESVVDSQIVQQRTVEPVIGRACLRIERPQLRIGIKSYRSIVSVGSIGAESVQVNFHAAG